MESVETDTTEWSSRPEYISSAAFPAFRRDAIQVNGRVRKLSSKRLIVRGGWKLLGVIAVVRYRSSLSSYFKMDLSSRFYRRGTVGFRILFSHRLHYSLEK